MRIVQSSDLFNVFNGSAWDKKDKKGVPGLSDGVEFHCRGTLVVTAYHFDHARALDNPEG
jgi:hypothetical protein